MVLKIKKVILVSLLLCLMGGFVTGSDVCQSSVIRPNIIFIMADDMGYADAGCFGGTQIQTPTLDRMAAEGMRFTQCYAGSTVCAPSRSVLMTGLHTGHTRVRGNFGRGGVVGLAGKPGRVPLECEDRTVAEVLQQAGYVTGMTGKWGLGEPNTPGLPNDQGFAAWFGYLNQRRAHSYYPNFLWLDRERFDLPGNVEGQQQQYTHDLFTGFALHFIRSHAEEPFFLYLPYTVPHARFEIPDLGPYGEKPWSAQEKVYAAMITRMDQHIGQLLALLRELTIDEKTVVFFCSDNGAANRYEGRFDSSGPLRGRKRDLYEGGIRTPMVVRWPGRISAGKVSDGIWSFTDFLATAADLAQAQDVPTSDGISIVPTLLGQEQDLDDRKLYWEFYERGFQQAARWRQWKAIRLSPQASIQLYDLKHDLGETTDVAHRYPEIVAEFATFFKTARTESQAFPSP